MAKGLDPDAINLFCAWTNFENRVMLTDWTGGWTVVRTFKWVMSSVTTEYKIPAQEKLSDLVLINDSD